VELTIVLENSYLSEGMGLSEENCLTDSKALIDLNRIESIRESFDLAGVLSQLLGKVTGR